MIFKVKTPYVCRFRNIGGKECNLTQGNCEDDKEFPRECPLRNCEITIGIEKDVDTDT